MEDKQTRGCLPQFNNTLAEERYLLHLELMKSTLAQADQPLLGLAEPTVAAKGTRRLHESALAAED